MNRRDFLGSTIKTAGALALTAETSSLIGLTATAKSNNQEADNFVPNPIAVSTYSFWRFREDSKLDMPKCIDLAAQMGFDGVELHYAHAYTMASFLSRTK